MDQCLSSTALLVSASAAIAAFFSAFAAFLSWRQQVQAYRNAIRPEIVFENWSFSRNADPARYEIRKVRNIGQGPARHLNVCCMRANEENNKWSNLVINGDPVAVLARGEAAICNASGIIWWENCLQTNDGAMVGIKIDGIYWDISGNRYKTTYHLIATQLAPIAAGAQELAPGLYLTNITNEFQNSQTLSLRHKYRKYKEKLFKLFPWRP